MDKNHKCVAKKLAMYLPYNLEFIGGGDRWIMYSASKDGAVLLKNGLHNLVVHEENIGEEYAAILKPMEKFNIDEQERCALDCSAPTNGEPFPQITVYARHIDWFCQNHYDIFGLIDAGLAVDYYSVPCYPDKSILFN